MYWSVPLDDPRFDVGKEPHTDRRTNRLRVCGRVHPDPTTSEDSEFPYLERRLPLTTPEYHGRVTVEGDRGLDINDQSVIFVCL